MKNPDDILNLIAGSMVPEEKRAAFSEVKDDSALFDLYRKLKIVWALMSATRKIPDYKVEESYQALRGRIFLKEKVFSYRSLYRYAAFFIVLFCTAGVAFYLGQKNSLLQNPELKFTSIVADKGQISKVILPDSSVVWLNAGTKLTYDNNYSYKNRNLNLSGQAFFQVKKNKTLPLVVASGDLRVKVLGTRFDVCAYPGEGSVHVFLESGKVELLNAADKSFQFELNPGQIAEYKPLLGFVSIKEAAKSDYFSWKDGELRFTDTPMKDVITQLERRFGVEFIVQDPTVYKSVFNASFKTESLNEILDYIRFSCQINYKVTGGNGTSRMNVILTK